MMAPSRGAVVVLGRGKFRGEYHPSRAVFERIELARESGLRGRIKPREAAPLTLTMEVLYQLS
jgi:hypothetical protein